MGEAPLAVPQPVRLYLTPLHHCTKNCRMRLTVNLESDLYAIAKSLAKAEDCTISAAVNRLLRRSLSVRETNEKRSGKSSKRNGFVVSLGRKPITAEIVRQIETEDDEA